VVDDVPSDALPVDDPDFHGFRDGWHAERVARGETLARAFSAAGLALEWDEDLTPLVLQRGARSLERRVRVSEGFRRALGSTRLGTLIGALHGGLMLERLYARGLVRYRLMVGRRRVSSG
jgi:hypothetical protein